MSRRSSSIATAETAETVGTAGTTLFCRSLPKKDAQVVVDGDGDLHLRVGTPRCLGTGRHHKHERATIFVCEPKTLSRASPVWKAMLYGRWAESRDQNNPAQGDWAVELPDDKPEPMGTILSIIHSNFESLPAVGAQDSIPRLYELAVLSDKYDLAKVLRPWANTWLQPLRAQYSAGWVFTRRAQFPWVYHKQLWVAWEFGDKFLLENTLQDMIINLASWEFDGLQPPDLLAKAQAVSENAVATIYYTLTAAANRFLPPPVAGAQPLKKWCLHSERQCHFIMLGSLMTSLTSCGLWPNGDPRQYSVRGLILLLPKLKLENGRGIIVDPRPLDILTSLGAVNNSSTPSSNAPSSSGISTAFGELPPAFSSAEHGQWRNPLYDGYDSNTRKTTYAPHSNGYRHDACHPAMGAHEQIKKACSGLSIQLDEAHLKHLKAQAAKTGI